MQIQEHVKLSTAAAIVALPVLKKDLWIPLAASVLIDVDHYLWHAVTHRTLSLRAAIRYFGQADPPQRPEARLLHHPIVLGALLFLGVRMRSRPLLLILAGLLFHVSLDVIHSSQMRRLKRLLGEQVDFTCPACGKYDEALQLHTLHFARNVLDRYNPRHFVVLCATCHEQAHATGSGAGLLRPQSYDEQFTRAGQA
ncbi:MAG TPA: hypothetical protein VKV20_06690 [Ktedonobacteraceae bacterium]|jgi:hypothetical protein|nr:hypothetical protein [Ktedonobacteraceae bacterium]